MPREVDAITKLYDYLLWLIPKLERFPRSQKFLLADRIEHLMLDILELLIEAAYTRNKRPMLRSANLKLEKLRYLLRLSKDLKLINIKTKAEFTGFPMASDFWDIEFSPPTGLWRKTMH